ncbi:MAG: SDR family oxidoreductase, partial [Hyphomicrobiales bacterium]|nr:SDR family oxidoreductase [Hyphomicrobiales bacterium]
AGFIGSNIVEALLLLGQRVTGLVNFATGHRHNLAHVASKVGAAWENFRLIEGDIRDRETCAQAMDGVDMVLHQAALGSVPRSLDDPETTHDVNVSGFLNMLNAARLNGCEAFVYAASSSTYGDEPNLPKVEERVGKVLSPYAMTKAVNETAADTFARCYGLEAVGLRYFNIFGPRQNPNGPYAAVIPHWIGAMLRGEAAMINGDGKTSRDFCFIDNAVQANLLAATQPLGENRHEAFNIAVGERTTLLELHDLYHEAVARLSGRKVRAEPEFRDFRSGDVRHSLADISKARRILGYEPSHRLIDGVDATVRYFLSEATVDG